MILLFVFAACAVGNLFLARGHAKLGNTRWTAWCWANVGWCVYGFLDTLGEVLGRM